MTVKEAAKKWNQKEDNIRKYLKSGLIPNSEKVNFRWTIGDDADWPPFTPQKAKIIVENVYEYSNENKVDLFSMGTDKQNIEYYKYLSKWGFISKIKCKNVEELKQSIKTVKVSKRGKKFIDKNEVEVQENVGAEIGTPFAKIHANQKKTYKKNTNN